jgi:hypothetical protein
MKKVQIRSFVKGGNHGQYLQAIGLAELIKRLLPDAEVTHLDYQNHFLKELKIQALSGLMPKFLVMRFYWRKNLSYSQLEYDADLTVYGSDMIWHLDSQMFPPDPIMFGEHDHAEVKISYAPSAGYRVDSEPQWISKLLKGFKALGVRDYSSASLVKDHCSVHPELVIDPCFHLLKSKYSKWIVNQKREDYISVYSPLTSTISKAFLQDLDFKSLPPWVRELKYVGYFPRKHFLRELYKQFTDPLWSVQQIAKSRLLVTSTFHGVMMALMTKTPFLAITSPNLVARLQSPIADVFSEKRLMSIEELTLLTSTQVSSFMSDVDFDEIKLKNYIDDSESWLASYLISDCD